MKTILTILFVAISITLVAQDIAEKEIKSEVAGVTVFFESAQISRTKKLDVSTGKTVLKFTELSPYIDAKSIQAKVKGQVSVLSVNHQLNFIKGLEKPEELIKLEGKLKSLQKKIKLENTYLAIINEEIQFLQSNKVIGGKNQELSITTLREASEFYGDKLTTLKLKEIERRYTLETLNDESRKIINQINTISSKKEYASGEILVTIKAEKSCDLTIDLSYVVANAGWYPSYDIRVLSVDKPLEIAYKANVHQDTKVDWKNVTLRLSSNNPEVSNITPELKTYYLNYGSVPPTYKFIINQVEGLVFDNEGNALPGVTVAIEGSTIRTSTDINGKYSLTLPANAGNLKYSYVGYKEQNMTVRNGYMNITMQPDLIALNEVVVTGAGDKRYKEEINFMMDDAEFAAAPVSRSLKSKSLRLGANNSVPMPVEQVQNHTSVEFEISIPYSVKSDSKNYVVDMALYEVPAYYEYLCIPKIDDDAFLIAKVDDWEELNLLEGEANLFFEETFVGKSILDVRFASDTISLSLGRDKNVSVKRTKVKDIKTKKFIGTKQEDTRAWEINIRNNKRHEINMLILDQVPVPMNEEIELNLADKSGAEYNDKNGEIKWIFSLEPQAKKEIKLKYSIKYPKNKQLVIE